MRQKVKELSGSFMKVIVVDDDPIFRSLVVSKLVRMSHEVVEAEDGSAAWQLLSHDDFQLALVDLEMPNMSGFELIRCIRSHPKTCRLPIVVVTSRNDADAVRGSLEAGATSFVTKPLNWSMFSNHIENLLRLHTAAERGHEIERRAIALIDEVEADITGRMSRMLIEARDALAQRRSLGGETRLAAALEMVVREAESVLVEMTGGAGQPPGEGVSLRSAS